ncbi:MAG: metallophosphoesterase [Clostridium sp.]|uniref:Ig-like domain-containing protein n=1 Tax=Butyribacter sp. TaxID=2822465 RepID=UPI002A96E5B9|nr:metallophosphoesterase [Clostridium sp.]MDY5180845.1 metallophosphoesterase [Butyribacter sp.]
MRKSRLFMSATAACLAGTMAVTGFAATEHWNDNSGKKAISDEWSQWKTKWETIKTDYEKVSMVPGADATKMNYAWYSKTADEAKIRISTNVDMSKTTEADGSNTYSENYKEFTGTSKEYKKIGDVTYYANKVTITELKENTTYYYQCLVDGKWTSVKKFKTGDTSNFSFLYVGDPQIGASKGQTPTESSEAQSADIAARNDAFSWNKTLTAAISEHSDVDFIVSAGDQINNTGDDNGQEREYAGFLSADVLSNVPVAPTIGNHDSKFANYQNHFNVPNAYTEEQNATPAGNDYYYTYGDVLFIVLNTNNYNCADHEALIKKAEQAAPNAKWKIVTFHHDIYGSGYDHSDSDGIVLRTQLTTLLDKYDIDVVLQGHDHTYSRSYMLTSDGNTHTAYTKDNVKDEYLNVKDGKTDDSAALSSKQEYLNQNLCYKIVDKTQGTINNPEGVLYMEANSATGSKYYNLISTQQDYIAERSQTWTPTYSVVNVTSDSFTINTYDVNTGDKIDNSFTITKKAEDKKDDTTKDNVAVKSIKLNKTKVTLSKGKKVKLKATVAPSNATDRNVTFTSSNTKVATVNAKGVVTAKKAGKATITAKAGTKKATCKIVVK